MSEEIIYEYFNIINEKKYFNLNSVLDINCNYRSFLEDSIFGLNNIVSYFDNHDFDCIIDDIIINKENFIYSVDWVYKNIFVNSKFEIVDNKIIKIVDIFKNSKKRIKCIVSYDGSRYHGYQIQDREKTIQGTIEDALFKITKEKIKIFSSGRTDKGVHAISQVFHFDVCEKLKITNWKQVLNNFLPSDIYIKSCERVKISFHSRYDVYSKEYNYIINTNEYNPTLYNYQWFTNIDNFNVLINELNTIIGKHDFLNLSKPKYNKNSIREIYSVDVCLNDGIITIKIIGNGFLRYMVRKIVGNLVDIANGKNDFSLLDIIESNTFISNSIAPPNGLYLVDVVYK